MIIGMMIAAGNEEKREERKPLFAKKNQKIQEKIPSRVAFFSLLFWLQIIMMCFGAACLSSYREGIFIDPDPLFSRLTWHGIHEWNQQILSINGITTLGPFLSSFCPERYEERVLLLLYLLLLKLLLFLKREIFLVRKKKWRGGDRERGREVDFVSSFGKRNLSLTYFSISSLFSPLFHEKSCHELHLAISS